MKNLKFEILTIPDIKESDKIINPGKIKKIARIYWKDKTIDVDIKHDNYGEYIPALNYLNPSDDILSMFFDRRFKDMIQTIRDGDADCFETEFINPFKQGVIAMPRYYLDRNIGEILRKKTIEMYKNFDFEIMIVYKDDYNMVYDEKILCKDGCLYYFSGSVAKTNINDDRFTFDTEIKGINIYYFRDITDKKMVFNTEKDALAEIEKIYAEAERIIKEGKYLEFSPKTNTEKAALEIIKTDKCTGKLIVKKCFKVIQEFKKED